MRLSRLPSAPGQDSQCPHRLGSSCPIRLNPVPCRCHRGDGRHEPPLQCQPAARGRRPMRIVIASSFVPFIRGGGRFIVDWLEEKLRDHGHQVEKFYLPSDERPRDPPRHAPRLSHDECGRWRRPAHHDPPPGSSPETPQQDRLVHPPHAWLLRSCPYRAFERAAHRGRTRPARGAHPHRHGSLAEARKIFTNSRVVGDRLRSFNGLQSEVLYPPLFDVSGFRFESANDEIVSVCRVEPHTSARSS